MFTELSLRKRMALEAARKLRKNSVHYIHYGNYLGMYS